MSDLLAHLSHLQLIAVKGEKARDFLQGQLTCDIREINATQTHLGAHCNPKGRVLATFQVIQFQDTIYLATPADLCDTAISQLKKYAVFAKVTLEKATQLSILGCAGDAMVTALQELLTALPQHPDQATSTQDLVIVRAHGTEPRYLIIGTCDAIAKLQQDLNLQTSYGDTIEQWRLMDIYAGIPTIYPATSDKFTPQMLNYPALNAVSFTKGCYTGQEIIARTHYLGKAKRHLKQLTLPHMPLPTAGSTVTDPQEEITGIVLDAAYNTQEACCILAVVHDSKNPHS